MTREPRPERTLDDYHAALAALSKVKAVSVRHVAWRMFGGSRVPAMASTVELALEELVALGRAERSAPAGHYRARLGKTAASEPNAPTPSDSDPHTLDEYARALSFAAERTPCKAEDVRRMVWGSKGGRDATELALDELERAGRADKVFGGRWKPRAATVPLVPGAMFSPMVANVRDVVRVTAASEDAEAELAALVVGDAPDGTPWVETPEEPDTGAGTDVPEFLVGGIPVRWGTTEVADGSVHEVDLSGLTGTARGTVSTDDPDAEVEPTEGDGEEAPWDDEDRALLNVPCGPTRRPRPPRTIDDIAAKHGGPFAVIARERRLLETREERIGALKGALLELEAGTTMCLELIAGLQAGRGSK